MKYSLISFDDNTFFNARLSINDMVCIERYIKKNPLTIFYSYPQLGDLAFILYMSLRYTTQYTYDDVFDIIDEQGITTTELIKIVISLLTDMGFLEDPKKVKEKKSNNSNSKVDTDITLVEDNSSDETLEQTMEKILENYLLIDTEDSFWSSSLKEVTSKFEFYRNQGKRNSEDMYTLALMISTNVALSFGGKKIPSFEQYFPNFYSKEESDKIQRDQRTREATNNLMKNISLFNKGKELKRVQEEIKK